LIFSYKNTKYFAITQIVYPVFSLFFMIFPY